MSHVPCLRIHADPDGVSHFSDGRIELEPGGSGVGVSASMPASGWEVRVVPPGWSRNWAPAAERRIAIYLSGQGEIEASDGEVRALRAGMVLVAEDTEGRGHRVRVVGDEPVVVVHLLPSD